MNGCHMGLSPARNSPSHNSLTALWHFTPPFPPHTRGFGGVIAYVCVLSRAWPDPPVPSVSWFTVIFSHCSGNECGTELTPLPAQLRRSRLTEGDDRVAEVMTWVSVLRPLAEKGISPGGPTAG